MTIAMPGLCCKPNWIAVAQMGPTTGIPSFPTRLCPRPAARWSISARPRSAPPCMPCSRAVCRSFYTYSTQRLWYWPAWCSLWQAYRWARYMQYILWLNYANFSLLFCYLAAHHTICLLLVSFVSPQLRSRLGCVARIPSIDFKSRKQDIPLV